MEQHEVLKRHYQAAMKELHHVPEVQLLERVSAALDGLTNLKIIQPLHALCLNLLKASEVEIPDGLKAAHDMKYQTADQLDAEKRQGVRVGLGFVVTAVGIGAVTSTISVATMAALLRIVLCRSVRLQLRKIRGLPGMQVWLLRLVMEVRIHRYANQVKTYS